MSKQVNIQIAQADLEMLKSNNYALCVAKQVNGAYNVVWQAATDYLTNNLFAWQSDYLVFATNQFISGMQVSIASEVNINVGQTATIDSNGSIGNPSTGGAANAITLINNYSPIYPGIGQLLIDTDGNEAILPIYVAENPVGTGGAMALTPVDAVLVWFQPNMSAGTMFGFMPGGAIEVNLTNADQATWLYQGGQWIQQS